jgi:hypothetical protein
MKMPKEDTMKYTTWFRLQRGTFSAMIFAFILTFAGVQGFGSTANAYDAYIILDPGVACAGFGLGVEITGSTQVYKEFVDKNGNIIRSLSAGKGSDFVFINLSSGAKFRVKGNGSVAHITYHNDNTYTYTATGHNVLIFFPTDVPAGPSTMQYEGHIVFTVDENTGVSTVQEISGRQIDICAALSK